ncbi:MAG: sulfotransferase [Ilumatobacteraceae bacterium]
MSPAARCLLVLGTHRSGTSITTALVQALGFELGGPLLHVGDENPLGHFEHVEVLNTQDRYLHDLGLEWFQPVDPWQLAGETRRRQWCDEMTDLYASITDGAEQFAIKDPRLVRFLPLWWAVFRRLKVRATAMVTLRDPQSTASSLARRNQMAAADAERLWCYDMESIRRNIGRCPHGIVRYEDLVTDPVVTMRRGFARAGLQWQPSAEPQIRQLVDPGLDRSHAGGGATVPMAAARYREILGCSTVGAWRALAADVLS